MSFTASREYQRAILRPLQLSATVQSAQFPIAQTRFQSETSSAAWRATTHVFTGTEHREVNRAWPPSSFEQDPSAIPDDDKYNVPYDPQSTSGQQGLYHLYDPRDPEKTTEAGRVPPPSLVAKRYIPTYNDAQRARGSTRANLTLLMLPGMGVPKEMFEPFLEMLLVQLSEANVCVDEIWSLDMPLSGETALLNPIGYLYGNEKDIARDILLFVTAYLPLTPAHALPEALVPRQPTSYGQQPVRTNLHVLAHSLGAQSAMLAAAHAPDIFSGLTVLDPAMIPPGKINTAFTKLPKDVLCTNIQYRHCNRESVATALRSNKRTRGWNERAMEIFTQRGVLADPEGGVRLVAHPRLEWALYYDQETPAQCYDRLTDISIPFHAIMPARPFAVPPKQLEADVGKMSGPTKITWIANATHQLPFERPDECVRAAALWLTDLIHKDPRTARL